MKALVTGGTGLVGSTINADIKWSSKDVDLTDSRTTLGLFEFFKPKKPKLEKGPFKPKKKIIRQRNIRKT